MTKIVYLIHLIWACIISLLHRKRQLSCSVAIYCAIAVKNRNVYAGRHMLWRTFFVQYCQVWHCNTKQNFTEHCYGFRATGHRVTLAESEMAPDQFTVHSHCSVPIQIKCSISIILLYIPMEHFIKIVSRIGIGPVSVNTPLGG